LSLDSKPSDGAALALRTNAPIYFNETLLKEMGEKTC
jgi:bifunctional DNase/RNase